VWLNNPRRPQEASGTSGQKVLLNGGLNFSVIDGWWGEAYDGLNGFAIGDGVTHVNTTSRTGATRARSTTRSRTDRAASTTIATTTGVPRGWVERMKRTIRTLGWRFNTDRMVIDYARECYLPAAGASSCAMPKVEQPSARSAGVGCLPQTCRVGDLTRQVFSHDALNLRHDAVDVAPMRSNLSRRSRRILWQGVVVALGLGASGLMTAIAVAGIGGSPTASPESALAPTDRSPSRHDGPGGDLAPPVGAPIQRTQVISRETILGEVDKDEGELNRIVERVTQLRQEAYAAKDLIRTNFISIKLDEIKLLQSKIQPVIDLGPPARSRAVRDAGEVADDPHGSRASPQGGRRGRGRHGRHTRPNGDQPRHDRLEQGQRHVDH
jgi:hypothetical protein